MKTIQLKPKNDARVRNGHLWIFSNEIQSNLKGFEPGEIVEVADHNGYFIGDGYANPHSLIAVRLLTRQHATIDGHFIFERIREAAERRKYLVPEARCYRLVFGESDFLPGLVIDRYEEFFVVQSLTAGIERMLPWIYEAIKKLFNPKGIVERNDSSIRKLEHLELNKKIVAGDVSEKVNVDIDGLTFKLDLVNGQKTGFFLDQRENQKLTRAYVKDKRVLDCFSHVGGWSLNAARFGAREVIGLDISETAANQCREHAEINGLQQCSFKAVNVFDELKKINDAKERWDVIILDPPAFAKSRSEVKDAIKGYREINRRAAKALTDGGILITCSCSHAIDPETFRNTVQQGLVSAGRDAVLLEIHGQPKDHPIHLSMRETEYLKCLVIQVN
ncbi:class I SAM-dependent rRNA methyltransferase [bacterium]|nr:class I SAM-dependent rRNA methyltransferase [bacterium]